MPKCRDDGHGEPGPVAPPAHRSGLRDPSLGGPAGGSPAFLPAVKFRAAGCTAPAGQRHPAVTAAGEVGAGRCRAWALWGSCSLACGTASRWARASKPGNARAHIPFVFLGGEPLSVLPRGGQIGQKKKKNSTSHRVEKLRSLGLRTKANSLTFTFIPVMPRKHEPFQRTCTPEDLRAKSPSAARAPPEPGFPRPQSMLLIKRNCPFLLNPRREGLGSYFWRGRRRVLAAEHRTLRPGRGSR